MYRLKLSWKIFNKCVKIGTFLDILKYADVAAVFKKTDSTNKRNYRPITTPSTFLKIVEKLVVTQTNSFTESKLSKQASLKTVIIDMPF